MRPLFKVGFFSLAATALLLILEHVPVFKYSHHSLEKTKQNKVCVIGRRCAATERLFKEAILGQKEPEVDQKGALPAPKGLMQLEVSGLSGKAQVFGKRCTNEWNPQ